jgi:hypothetical protein
MVNLACSNGPARTTMSHSANLNTSLLAAGTSPPSHILSGSYITFYINNRDGRYGLYLDDTLLDGSSARCPTFDNEPLCSSSGAKKGGNVTFECVGLEVWAVGPT